MENKKRKCKKMQKEDYLHRTILEQDILSVKFKNPYRQRSLLEAKVPAVKSRTSCVYADLRDLISEMELRKAA